MSTTNPGEEPTMTTRQIQPEMTDDYIRVTKPTDWTPEEWRQFTDAATEKWCADLTALGYDDPMQYVGPAKAATNHFPADTVCPEWCTEHQGGSELQVAWHSGEVSVPVDSVMMPGRHEAVTLHPFIQADGFRYVDVCETGSEGFNDLLYGLSPTAARELAAALVRAADMAEEVGAR